MKNFIFYKDNFVDLFQMNLVFDCNTVSDTIREI